MHFQKNNLKITKMHANFSLMGINMQWGRGGGGISPSPPQVKQPLIYINFILCILSHKFVYIILTDIFIVPTTNF